MNLVYILYDDFFHINSNKGFQLSSKYNVHYNEASNELVIEKNTTYIEKFWGDNIFDVIAVVGENGAGKTSLCNSIVNVFARMEGAYGLDCNFIVIFEDEEEDRLEIYITDKYARLSIWEEKIKRTGQIISKQPLDILMQYKIGYFSNAISFDDFRYQKLGYVYDASIGRCMRRHWEEQHEKKYIGKDKNLINIYYWKELEAMVKFIFSDFRKMDIPFALPSQVVLFVNKYFENEEYLSNEVEKMRKKSKELDALIGIGQFSFQHKYISEIKKKFRSNWTNNVVINILMSFFNAICIPQYPTDNKSVACIEFIKCADEWIKKEMEKYDDCILMIKDFILYVSERVRGGEYYSKEYIDFLIWLDANKTYFKHKGEEYIDRCILPIDDDYRDIVITFMNYYEKTSLVFPYLRIEFGLSTGEFNFLNLFTKLTNMLDSGLETKKNIIYNETVVSEIECTNILLIFDEADLSLHPRWQQKYLDWLLRFISTYFQNYKIHIIIMTHSPIMLSDFPRNNVLYLNGRENGGNLRREIDTFGNNIHTLFLDSFFLNDTGTIGTFAERKINEVAEKLLSDEPLDNEKEIEKIIDYIGDDIIRNKLMQLYESKTSNKIERNINVEKYAAVDMTISLLEKQKEQIEEAIRELKHRRYD